MGLRYRRSPLTYLAWFTAALCVIATMLISTTLIVRHLEFYVNPSTQKYVVRILFMAPIYAMDSLLALTFVGSAACSLRLVALTTLARKISAGVSRCLATPCNLNPNLLLERNRYGVCGLATTKTAQAADVGVLRCSLSAAAVADVVGTSGCHALVTGARFAREYGFARE